MKCKDCGNTHPALSGFPNHVLCDYYHIHMSNIADASRCEHFKPKVTTNADRIRAMTDEGLAEYLCKAIRDGVKMIFPGAHYSKDDIAELNQDWLDWLKQEVTNNSTT